MTVESCPNCHVGKFYSKPEASTGVALSKCFACGYYAEDSDGYKKDPELHRYLFKKHFPKQVAYEVSAEFRHVADSADKWTEPILLKRHVLPARTFLMCQTADCDVLGPRSIIESPQL